jgi:mevalonate kinase
VTITPKTITRRITVSAPGKIHLMGEHAVVYGFPALLATINRRVYVTGTLIPGKEKKDVLTVLPKEAYPLIKRAYAIVTESYKISNKTPISISVSSSIPIGRGLGSSAALSVAGAATIARLLTGVWNPTRTNELAFSVEKMLHGNPSGGDNTVITFGGLVWYRKEFEFLRSIWSLPMAQYKIPQFYLIDSGKSKESTKIMVEYVQKCVTSSPRRLLSLFSDQEIQTKRLLLALRSGNLEELKKAIQTGEKNLESLSVVGSRAKRIIRVVENLGGCAKVTGAGGQREGSGMLLAYHDNPEIFKEIKRKCSVDVTPVLVGQEGVRIEQQK